MASTAKSLKVGFLLFALPVIVQVPCWSEENEIDGEALVVLSTVGVSSRFEEEIPSQIISM